MLKDMNKYILIAILFFLLPKIVLAETIISDGFISINQTWTASGSPYLVNASVYIPEGVTLNIGAGTRVEMQNGRKFDIYGVLNINGSVANNVYFTAQGEDGIDETSSTPAGRWGGFVFYSGSKASINYLDIKFTGGAVWPPPGGPAFYNFGGEIWINNSRLDKNFCKTGDNETRFI